MIEDNCQAKVNGLFFYLRYHHANLSVDCLILYDSNRSKADIIMAYMSFVIL